MANVSIMIILFAASKILRMDRLLFPSVKRIWRKGKVP